jgi:hypothetical protein
LFALTLLAADSSLTLKDVNVGASTMPYDSCPYCLTEVAVGTEAILVEKSPKVETSLQDQEKKQESLPDAPKECKNHFGDLGHRESEEIPDECLTCSLIVQCMLKKAKEQVGLS